MHDVAIQDILEFFTKFNIQTLIGMAILLWYFSKHIDSKIDSKIGSLNNKLDANIIRMDRQIEIQTARSDKLYQMFIDLLKTKRSD